MSLRLTLRRAAQEDVANVVHWYATQLPELGDSFITELDRLLVRVAENPFQFPVVETGVRRGLMRRFPFGVYFLAQPEQIDVIAVLHLHRKPNTWRSRR